MIGTYPSKFIDLSDEHSNEKTLLTNLLICERDKPATYIFFAQDKILFCFGVHSKLYNVMLSNIQWLRILTNMAQLYTSRLGYFN